MQKEKAFSIIKQIEKIRKANNMLWMSILKLSFKHAPRESAVIMKNISERDGEITKLTKALSRTVK